MRAQGRIAERVLPAVAVGLGWSHVACLGGLETPASFTRAVLVVGVLCPLMMGESSSRIGHVVLRPQARLLPLFACFVFGPALALGLGHWLLDDRPEQAAALLLLSILPGSTLVPLWASSTGASKSTATALTLIGWAMACFVGLPLLTGSHAAIARFIAFRDLAFLGVMPLAAASLLRVILRDAFDADEHATMIEPLRRTVIHASFTLLVFTLTANKANARLIHEAGASLPALGAVALLHVGLIAIALLALRFRRRLSSSAASAALQVSVSRQTALALLVLPLMVAPSQIASAAVVPLFTLAFELVCGTAALALAGSWSWSSRSEQAGNPDGRPSILPG